VKTYKVFLPDTWLTVQAENEAGVRTAFLSKLIDELQADELISEETPSAPGKDSEP
jgi:hypothetical protein